MRSGILVVSGKTQIFSLSGRTRIFYLKHEMYEFEAYKIDETLLKKSVIINELHFSLTDKVYQDYPNDLCGNIFAYGERY